MSSKRLKAAILGAGGIGFHHAREFQTVEGVDVVALAEVNVERARQVAAQLGIPAVYADYRELLRAERPDVVAVGLPNHLHCPVTLDALAAGCHVICEKPPALTAREARGMAQAARRRKRLLTYHFNYRYTPASRFLGRWAAQGGFGEVYFARTGWHRLRGIPGLGGWFTDKKRAGGGPLIDLAVHRLDLALWLMGYPEVRSVCGAAFYHLARRIARESGKTMSVEDLACGFIRFRNGAVLVVEASWAGHTQKRESMFTELRGTQSGAVHRNVGEGYEWEARIFREEAGNCVEIRPVHETAAAPGFHAEFVAAIRAGAPPQVPPEQGTRLMGILEALYLSAETGREVRLVGDMPKRP